MAHEDFGISMELTREEMILLIGEESVMQLEEHERAFCLRLRHLKVLIWWSEQVEEERFVYEIEGPPWDLAEVFDFLKGVTTSQEFFGELYKIGYLSIH